MQSIQQQLLRDDVYLIGRVNTEPNDLARSAKASASSAQANGAAGNVLSGMTRAVHGPKGAPQDRAMPGTHRWMSDPAQGLPAWLELRWDSAVTIGHVQLIFDTGLHRPLTLTHSDAYAERMEWGHGQPETVRDYEVQVLVNDAWQSVASVKDNYQRRRVHVFEPVTTAALRVHATAVNGIDHARICEVRAY